MSFSSYPIQLNLGGRAVLVVGAGAVAARKLTRLVACGAKVSVVAPRCDDPVREMANEGRVILHERAFADEDVRASFLVIAATDDAATNERVARCARRAGALVLRADAPSDSDFTLPSFVQTDHVDATISTRGEAPAASRRLGRELSLWLSAGPDRFVAEIARVRVAGASRADQGARLRALADGPLFEACRASDESRISELVTGALEAP